jgi:hypothetical protein
MSKLNPQKWGVFMIGYSISVYEFVEGMDITSISNDNEALATWTSGGFGGLDWIDNLVSESKAEHLGGNGYPDYYKVKAQVVLQALSSETPKNKGQTIIDDENVMSADWRSKIDTSEIAKVKPNQQLLIEAWDLS